MENVSFTDHVAVIQLLDYSELAINKKKTMTSQFADFDVTVFLLSSLLNGTSFMSTSLLVLVL